MEETHLLGGGLCLLEEVVLHLHLDALDPLQGCHLEGYVEVQVEDVHLHLLPGADHHLDDHVVLLEGLQLVVDVLALQYVGLRAHAQGHSHLAEVDHRLDGEGHHPTLIPQVHARYPGDQRVGAQEGL